MYDRPFSIRIIFFIMIILNLIISITILDKPTLEDTGSIWNIITPLILVVLTNFIVVRDIRRLIINIHTHIEVLKNFIIIVLYGLLNIILFALIYYSNGIAYNVDDISVGDISLSLYFSIVTWTTLGYGDFRPIESLRLIASFEALIGYVYMALLIGIFLNIIKIKVK